LDQKKATVVTYEEQIKGLYALVRKSETQTKQSQANSELLEKRLAELIDELSKTEARALQLQTQLAETYVNCCIF
jgi:chromosome segregation ATPase